MRIVEIRAVKITVECPTGRDDALLSCSISGEGGNVLGSGVLGAGTGAGEAVLVFLVPKPAHPYIYIEVIKSTFLIYNAPVISNQL